MPRDPRFSNGADKQELGGIEMAGPGYFPPDYRGTMAVLISEFDAQQPSTFTFNLGEQKASRRSNSLRSCPGRRLRR